jgi:hypothetical protein
MDLECLVRQSATSTEVHVTAQTLAAQHGLLETPDLPARTFLRVGASPTPIADMPPWAHGMVTRAEPVASANGLPAARTVAMPPGGGQRGL